MIRPDSAPARLLSFIAICGDFPSAALSLVLGRGSYPKRVVTDLHHRKLITIHAANNLRSYRLTAAGRDILSRVLPVRCGPYLSCPQIPKSEYPRRLRNHRVAETYVLMERAGVEIFVDRKMWPFKEVQPYAPMLTAFYGSREVRACGKEAAKIKNARFTGVLTAPSGVWLTYHTGPAAMKWEQKSEQRSKALISSILNGGDTLLRLSDVGGIMVGQDMAVAYELLTSNGGIKRAYFRVDGTFTRFPFIPIGEEGELVLKLLCSKEIAAKLRSVLLRGYEVSGAAEYLFTCDAFDEQGNAVLLACDFDLQRISSFVNGLRLHNLTGTVFCFDFQKDTLQKYAGERVKVETVDRIKFERRFLNSTPEN